MFNVHNALKADGCGSCSVLLYVILKFIIPLLIMVNKLLRTVGPLQLDLVKDWTAAIQHA